MLDARHQSHLPSQAWFDVGFDVTASRVASVVTEGVSPADLDQFGSLQVSQLLAGGDLH